MKTQIKTQMKTPGFSLLDDILRDLGRDFHGVVLESEPAKEPKEWTGRRLSRNLVSSDPIRTATYVRKTLTVQDLSVAVWAVSSE